MAWWCVRQVEWKWNWDKCGYMDNVWTAVISDGVTTKAINPPVESWSCFHNGNFPFGRNPTVPILNWNNFDSCDSTCGWFDAFYLNVLTSLDVWLLHELLQVTCMALCLSDWRVREQFRIQGNYSLYHSVWDRKFHLLFHQNDSLYFCCVVVYARFCIFVYLHRRWI